MPKGSLYGELKLIFYTRSTLPGRVNGPQGGKVLPGHRETHLGVLRPGSPMVSTSDH
jgi:hypothetical protein